MKTLRTLVAILALAAIAGTFTSPVVAAEATGRQPAMSAVAKKAVGKKAAGKADTKKIGQEGSKAMTKAKAGSSRMSADAEPKKAKGDKPLKAGKNSGGRKKAA